MSGSTLKERLLAWGADLPPVLAFLAIEAASISESGCQLLEWSADEFPVANLLSEYDEQRYYGYYDDPLSLIFDMLGAAGMDLTAQQRRILRQFYERYESEHFWRCDIGQPESWFFAAFANFSADLREAQQTCQEILDWQAEGISSSEMVDLGIDWKAFLQTPAGSYFFQVAAPCWLQHGEWPSQLWQRIAGQSCPDLPALTNLLQVDRRLLHHPRLRSILHAEDRKASKRNWHQVMDAVKTKRSVPSQVKIKKKFAGLISYVSQLLGHKLTQKKIETLFNLIAQSPSPQTGETRQQVLADPDLPTGDAFRKAIDRGRKDWNLGVEIPDKSLWESVRTLAAIFSYDAQHEPSGAKERRDGGGDGRGPAA